MSKSLSVDLRSRVVAAIDGGLSRHAAAEQFEVGVSSAIRWHTLHRTTGTIVPKPQGGDRRSHKTEAHGEQILSLYQAQPDVTLAELRSKLAEQGIQVSMGALWRFFDRHRISFKKSRRTQANKNAPML
jgi:transposase